MHRWTLTLNVNVAIAIGLCKNMKCGGQDVKLRTSGPSTVCRSVYAVESYAGNASSGGVVVAEYVVVAKGSILIRGGILFLALIIGWLVLV